MNHKLLLVSMSSADREFPAVYVRKNAGGKNAHVGVHQDVIWDNLVLINNGFPITFKGKRYESTPKEIEKTIGLLYGSTLEAITALVPAHKGFVDIPTNITAILEANE